MTDIGSADIAIKERLAFLDIDDETRAVLRELKPVLNEALGPALDRFYAKARATPETRRFFADDAHIAKAHAAQRRHWGVIAEAMFGDDYAAAVRSKGKVHARLGLEPRHYIGGYALIVEQLLNAIVKDRWPRSIYRGRQDQRGLTRALASLTKAAFLDMDLAISIYLEELDARRRESDAARAAAESNRNSALETLVHALRSLADGDMRTRLDCRSEDCFAEMSKEFNAAILQLQQTLSGIADSSAEVFHATDEILQATGDLARRTEGHAATLEEASSALQDITETISSTAATTRDAASSVAATRTVAEKSGEVVRRAVETMGRIEKSSRDIDRIIAVIDDIAFQTNLLALNAGVEAARAGESGRGFAVVAAEVRALAQRSAQAAKEIKILISTSGKEVADGVVFVAQAGEALEQIVERISEIDAVFVNIAGNAAEQASGLTEVSRAVGQIDTATQQNAAMVEETMAACQNLHNQASFLSDSVSRFNLGKRRPAAAAAIQKVRRPAVASAAARLETEPAAGEWAEF